MPGNSCIPLESRPKLHPLSDLRMSQTSLGEDVEFEIIIEPNCLQESSLAVRQPLTVLITSYIWFHQRLRVAKEGLVNRTRIWVSKSDLLRHMPVC